MQLSREAFIVRTGLVGCVLALLSCGPSEGSTPTTQNRLSLPVRFESKTIFVGGFAEVGVEIAPGFGIEFEDLEFKVDPKHGSISLSRGADFDTAKPTIMLNAGTHPGVHPIEAFTARPLDWWGEERSKCRGGCGR